MIQDQAHCKMCQPTYCQGSCAEKSESEKAYFLEFVMRDAKLTVLGWVDTNLECGLVGIILRDRWTVLAFKLGWVTPWANSKRA